MATIEIDPEDLASALATAIMGAIKAAASKKEEIPTEREYFKDNPLPQRGNNEFTRPVEKKKRGRPPTKKQPKTEEIIIPVGDLKESLKEVLDYSAPVQKAKSSYVVAARRAGVDNIVKSNEPQNVVDPNRKIKFMDDRSVPSDNAKYAEPIPTERPPAKKGKFRCDSCFQDFEGYYTEFPQALLTYKDPTVGEHLPGGQPR